MQLNHKNKNSFKIEKKAKIRNQYNQVPTDPGHLMVKRKNTRKHNTQENQEVSSLPTGDDKAGRNGQDSMRKINLKHK